VVVLTYKEGEGVLGTEIATAQNSFSIKPI